MLKNQTVLAAEDMAVLLSPYMQSPQFGHSYNYVNLKAFILGN
jgi:hypothetical protein